MGLMCPKQQKRAPKQSLKGFKVLSSGFRWVIGRHSRRFRCSALIFFFLRHLRIEPDNPGRLRCALGRGRRGNGAKCLKHQRLSLIDAPGISMKLTFRIYAAAVWPGGRRGRVRLGPQTNFAPSGPSGRCRGGPQQEI